MVKNPQLDESSIAKLTAELTAKAETLRHQSMIGSIFEIACEWSDGNEHNIIDDTKQKQCVKPKERRTPKRRPAEELPGCGKGKLPPMKTAEDVISRIMWDDSIPTECFYVGYEDRFVGIVERQFTDFSWEDLASVDYDTLAIPRHRIQYFKYKDLIVWEKSKRLDNVFGSTGSGLKITQVVDQFESENPAFPDYGHDYDDSDSDQDDEDVVIKVNSDVPAESQVGLVL